MGLNARTIINAAFMDCGILGQGETLGPAEAQDGLRRLNALVNSWRAQSLTVPAIQRTIFPLIANQQTYTIGPGGDFDVPRPTSISGAGLWLNGLGSAVSCTITSSGYVATVTQTAHGHSVGDEVLIDGATETAYNGLQTVDSVPSANSWTYTLDDTTDTPATGTIVAYPEGDQPVEIPRALYTDDSYQAIQIKTLANSLFTGVYYNATASPYGTITLWPKPNTAQNQLVLYLAAVFTGFADLTTDYGYPETPGYQDALEYNLAKRLIAPYGVSNPVVTGYVTQMAGESLGLIKRQNYKISDLPSDTAAMLSGDRRAGYNINTGTGGGN